MTLLLSNDDVERALTADDTIIATEKIYRELAEGVAPARTYSFAKYRRDLADRFRQ